MPSTGDRHRSSGQIVVGHKGSHRRRAARAVAVAAAALLIVGVLPPLTASAIIGASSSPLTTAGPDLRTAAVVDAGAGQTRFCFDQPVANFNGAAPANHTSYHLVGYDDIVTATGTSIGSDPGSANCVLVNFATGNSDLSQYTVGTVDAGALTNASGSNMNIEGAAALTNINLGSGGVGGRMTGPDLVSAAKDGTIPNDILYTFDEKLLPTFCDFTKFGHYTTDAVTVKRQDAIACNISGSNLFVARVSFPNTTNAGRFFVETSAVMDRGGDGNSNPNLNPLSSTTTATATFADLTAVNRIDDNTVDYTFDRGTATTCDPSRYFVFEEDTSPYTATTCSIRSSSASSTVIRAGGFGTTNFSSFETPSAGVDDAAMDVANSEGALSLATSREASGFTDAPDLESADFDTSFNRVTYNFDEIVNTVNAANYFVVNNDDVKSPSSGGLISQSGNKVTMGYTPSEINTAVGTGVSTGAATDFPGNSSAEASVGRGPAPLAGTLQFSSSTYSASEGAGGCPGGGAQLVVTRNGGSSGAASVTFSTSNGSATAGSDYTSVSTPLSWGDGDSSSRSVCVPILQDSLAEGSETFGATLSGATGATLGAPSTATVTILDDDTTTGNLSFSSSAYSQSESGNALITVVRSGGSTGQITVDFSTSNGSAIAGSDYNATSGTLVFPNGVTSQTFTVPIINDTQAESNETVNLNLTNPQGGGGLTLPNSAVLTIVDNDTVDPGSLAFSSASYSVGEAGIATITVNRSGGSTGQVTVNFAATSGSATAGTDFTSTTGTLTFAAGEVSKTFTVGTVGDSNDEADETVNLSLSAPTGGATLGSPSTSTLTILDDDQGDVTLRSGVTLQYKPRRNAFSGRVFFPDGATAEQAAACRANRTIVLTRRGRFITSAVSNANGRWRIGNFRNPFGSYRATVNQAVRSLGDSSLTCTRAQSGRLFL